MLLKRRGVCAVSLRKLRDLPGRGMPHSRIELNPKNGLDPIHSANDEHLDRTALPLIEFEHRMSSLNRIAVETWPGTLYRSTRSLQAT